ncbi:MAG: DUF560 domain-containing protein [Elusimicrobia bacterium]|nr:DUF560 domain-containing protein [Elusimicrobiota bacterium]
MKNLMALILTILVAAPAWPQDLDEESRKAAQAAEARSKGESAAQDAKARRAVEDAGAVTYEMVLAKPDDVDLNYRWAKAQVERGDLKGASATLERILMVKPSLTRVRLTYALVLYRLDSLPEARRELEIVKGQASGAVKAEAEEYIRLVDQKTRLTHLHGTLGVGYQFDDNRNAGPSSNQRLFGGVPVNLTTGRATDDTSVLFLAAAGIRRDLRGNFARALVADLSYYRAEQTTVNTLDLQAYSFSAGPEFQSGRLTVTPALVFDHVRLSEETYLRTRGGRVRVERRLSKRLAVFGQGQVMVYDHIRTSDIPTATERTGNESTLRGGAIVTLTPTQRLTAETGYQQKDARKMYNAYERNTVGLTHAWLLGKGRFLLSGLNVDLDRYAAPELAIARQERKDDKTRVSWTFGQPLGFLGKPFAPLLLTVSYEYLHANSNITNYAYTNNKVNGMLTYRWDY